MSHTVTRLCRENVDTACVAVCPVDCFYIVKDATADLPRQLYISPAECIDCGACVEACPWQAIYPDADVPPTFADDTPLNVRCDTERDLFDKAVNEPKHTPSPEEVEANKKKWGL